MTRAPEKEEPRPAGMLASNGEETREFGDQWRHGALVGVSLGRETWRVLAVQSLEVGVLAVESLGSD